MRVIVYLYGFAILSLSSKGQNPLKIASPKFDSLKNCGFWRPENLRIFSGFQLWFQLYRIFQLCSLRSRGKILTRKSREKSNFVKFHTLYSIFSAPFFNDFYDNPLPTNGAYDRSTFWLDTLKRKPKSLPSAPKMGTLLAEPIEGSYPFLSPSAPWWGDTKNAKTRTPDGAEKTLRFNLLRELNLASPTPLRS